MMAIIQRPIYWIGSFLVIGACDGESGSGKDGGKSGVDTDCVADCLDKGYDQTTCDKACVGFSAKEEGDDKDWGDRVTTQEIIIDNVVREYHMFAPTNPLEEDLALLVAVHGGDEADYYFPQSIAFEHLAEEEGIVIIYPHAKQVRDNEGAWQLNTDSQSQQDIEFIGALIDDISTRYAIDEARVYAMGHSLGSMFSYELVCQMSFRFAAVASHGGSMPVTPTSCNQTRNVPIMHIHGVGDSIIPYSQTWDWKNWDSVGTMRDIPGLIDYWEDKYNCQNATNNGPPNSIHIVHDQCEEDARVEHYRLEGAGHEWPETIRGTSTHQVIWSFLTSFTNP